MKTTLLEYKLTNTGRQACRKTSSQKDDQEDNLTGRRTHRKMSLAQLSPSLLLTFLHFQKIFMKVVNIFLTKQVHIPSMIYVDINMCKSFWFCRKLQFSIQYKCNPKIGFLGEIIILTPRLRYMKLYQIGALILTSPNHLVLTSNC